MKKLFSKTAITLLELIIASALVSVVILGIFAVNNVLSNNNQDYGQKYLVKSETQTTLNHILNNAALAVGSGINIGSTLSPVYDQGILIGSGDLGIISDPVNNPNSFCIHQDIIPTASLDSSTVNSPPTTTPYDATSRWLCYTWYASGMAHPNQIWYCAMPYNSSSLPYRGASSCNAASNPNISVQPVYLGTAFTNPTATFSSAAGGQMVFSLTIQNCLNDTPVAAGGTCNPSLPGGSSNPASNPGVQVSGSVYPSQEGMQQS